MVNINLLLVAFAIHSVFAKSPATFNLPKISFQDLLGATPDVGKEVLAKLTELGALQIVDIPGFGEARKEALGGLGSCLSKEEGAPSMVMSDGSKRVSTGAVSVHGKASAVISSCGSKATRLRNIIHGTSMNLFHALDENHKVTGNMLLMQPSYHNFEELMSQGEHLEHLHSYYSPTQKKYDHSESIIPTMDFHIDAGLMIAMTTGYYTGSEATTVSGLYLELPGAKKERVKVGVEENALIVLMGDGASRWLAPIYGHSFRAVPHAMIADLPVSTAQESVSATPSPSSASSASSRSWYGKMYLPPADAMIVSEGLPYAKYHYLSSLWSSSTPARTSNKQTQSSYDYANMLPSACGPPPSNFLLSSSPHAFPSLISHTQQHSTTNNHEYTMLITNTLCTLSDHNTSTTGVMCWLQCQPVDTLSCGLNALCTNPDTGTVNDGTTMCHTTATSGTKCGLTCPVSPSMMPTTPPTAVPTTTLSESTITTTTTTPVVPPYCTGGGVTMFMEGFRSIFWETPGTTACIIFLFPHWTLNTITKYMVACLFTFLLGIWVQYLGKLRLQIPTIFTTSSSSNDDEEQRMRIMTWRKGLHVLLFSLQVITGYGAMLIAMTYSVELFVLLCAGMIVGFVVCHLESPGRMQDVSLLDGVGSDGSSSSSSSSSKKKKKLSQSILNEEDEEDEEEELGNCCGTNNNNNTSSNSTSGLEMLHTSYDEKTIFSRDGSNQYQAIKQSDV